MTIRLQAEPWKSNPYARYSSHRIEEIINGKDFKAAAQAARVILGRNMRIVGTGNPGFEAAGTATAARDFALNSPGGIAYDPHTQTTIVADTENHRVVRVDPFGGVTPIAGTGQPGMAQDGDVAAEAPLNRPMGVAVDEKGQVFIADSGNHRVWCVDNQGHLQAVAGNGARKKTPKRKSPRSFARTERKWKHEGDPAHRVPLKTPVAIAFYQGSVLIVDTDDNQIKRVTKDGRIWTFAGSEDVGRNGLPTFDHPTAIAVDEKNAIVYVADTGHNRIRKIVDGAVGTIIDLQGVAGFDGDGGQGLHAHLNRPQGLAVVEGGLLVADTHNHRIRLFDREGNISTVIGNGDGSEEAIDDDSRHATSMQLSSPTALAVDELGIPLIADTKHHRIVRAW